ncbi:MAG TPA: CPBP family intramembrane glutamic endopeptidase [Marmoricola sp.]|jgi:membrane protease YdiL (CAAX protease family)|nr:CPBP family intramembrane glutamic endopeptidase [Marmoricola sp.]
MTPVPTRGTRRIARLGNRLPKPLNHVAPVSHHEDPAVMRRRRRVVGVVTLIGAGALGVSLSTRPGSRAFYTSTSVVAGVWTLGGLLSGPLHRGWVQSRDDRLHRPVVTPVVTGAAAFAVFYVGGQVARRIPPLRRAVSDVLAFAEEGDDGRVLLVTLANGVGEEIFFRGALYTALGERHPATISTLVYTLATTTTRNPALVLAAAVMGSLFGLQRRASQGVQAPLLTHLTWSSLMVRFLPPLFRRRPQA